MGIHKLKQLLKSLVQAREGGKRRIGTGELQQKQDLRLQVAVGEVEPVEVVGIVLVRRRERKSAVAVFVDDVLGAGSRLSESEVSILDYGSLTEWMEIVDRLWGEDGVALVELQ